MFQHGSSLWSLKATKQKCISQSVLKITLVEASECKLKHDGGGDLYMSQMLSDDVLGSWVDGS